MLAFFVVMYAISSVNEGKYRVLSDSLFAAFRGSPRTLQPVQVGEKAVGSGAVSIQGVLVGYLYPFTLFLGGFFLFLMRKPATVFFAIYVVWGIVRSLVPTGHSTSFAAIAVAVLFLAYSSYLLKEGRLA